MARRRPATVGSFRLGGPFGCAGPGVGGAIGRVGNGIVPDLVSDPCAVACDAVPRAARDAQLLRGYRNFEWVSLSD
jgi:hypothetical protein